MLKSNNNNTIHNLSSYGTLKQEEIKIETCVRKLNGAKGRLYRYRIEELKITDKKVLDKSQKKHHPIAVKSSDNKRFFERIIF